jgi:hypothetical protein
METDDCYVGAFRSPDLVTESFNMVDPVRLVLTNS